MKNCAKAFAKSRNTRFSSFFEFLLDCIACCRMATFSKVTSTGMKAFCRSFSWILFLKLVSHTLVYILWRMFPIVIGLQLPTALFSPPLCNNIVLLAFSSIGIPSTNHLFENGGKMFVPYFLYIR